MKTFFRVSRHHMQSGFTLLEVLVALLICSFGLLGIIGLQAKAIQFAGGSEDTSRAVMLANDIASTMLTSQSVNLSSTVVSAWQTRVSDSAGSGLPNGQGEVSVSGNVATIKITWRATSAASGAANSVNQYITDVVVP